MLIFAFQSRPTLGNTKQKVVLLDPHGWCVCGCELKFLVSFQVLYLGFLYYLFSGALAVSEVMERTETGHGSLSSVFIFPVAVLDTGFLSSK